MKIIHFHPDMRMAKLFVRPLIEAECAHSHKSELMSSSLGENIDSFIGAFRIYINIPFKLPFFMLTRWKYIKKAGPDIIFAHNSRSSFIPLLLALLAGVKNRVYFNHGVPYIAYDGIFRLILWILERLNMLLSTMVITVSSDMKEILKHLSPSSDIRVIHKGSACGLDLITYSESTYTRDSWRLRNDINTNDLVVTYIGRPVKRKGFDTALHIWRDCCINREDIKLIMCGPTFCDAYSVLDEIPPNLICLGFVSNIAEVLSGADILILPSKHEGLSYACLEAQACSTVPIANNICGLRNVIKNNFDGFLVDNNDERMYGLIINRLYHNRPLLQKLKNNTRSRSTIYSREDFMASYLVLLDSMDPVNYCK